MITLDLKPKYLLSEFDKALITATYFGFTPIAAPKILEQDLEMTNHCRRLPYYDAAEKAALIRAYLSEDMSSLPHPLTLIYKRKGTPRGGSSGYSLHYIGATSGIAEATLIRAALSILNESGFRNLRLDLNSIGDKDSLLCYERELINFVKKSGSALSDELRLALKDDIFNLFRLEEEALRELSASAPPAITYLTPPARSHFKEVLEFVEALGIEFSLSPELVGEKNHVSHTIFAIKSAEPEGGKNITLAVGYRYSRLLKRFGIKREIPMAAVSIFTANKKEVGGRVYKELPKPKFYLVQLGREAKIRTLGLIENLRREKISVHHFLGKDKLTAQLGAAEMLSLPYLIIIGQKEALDGTATVRNVLSRAQDTISLSQLPSYLKRITL